LRESRGLGEGDLTAHASIGVVEGIGPRTGRGEVVVEVNPALGCPCCSAEVKGSDGAEVAIIEEVHF